MSTVNSVLVETGEFKVDMDSRRRKLAEEDRKIMRHRIGLVWYQLGNTIGCTTIVSTGVIIGALIGRPVKADMVCGGIMAGFTSCLICIGFCVEVKPAIDRVILGWDP